MPRASGPHYFNVEARSYFEVLEERGSLQLTLACEFADYYSATLEDDTVNDTVNDTVKPANKHLLSKTEQTVFDANQVTTDSWSYSSCRLR